MIARTSAGPGGARRRPARWYRRAPTVVSYWAHQHFVVHNYLTSARVTGPPVVADVLHFFDTWRTADDLAQAVPHAAPLLEQLADETLLDRWNGRGDPPPPHDDAWSLWNPAAGFMHFSTKDDFDTDQDLEQAEREIHARADTLGHEAPAKRSAGPGLALEQPSKNSDFERVLIRRRTWREFDHRPLERAAVARLLSRVWGVQAWLEGTDGRSALRTSPSAGARHVIEVYLVALRVNGLDPGFYHYEMDRHRLVRLPGRVSQRTLERFIPRQWWFHGAPALFVMSAVFKRAQLRYPFPRAYRSVLLEAGHFCQTFCLLSESLGLAPFCTHALADRVVERALRLDGVTESVVYAAGVGHRPGDGVWRPWPEHEPGHPYRPPSRRRVT